MDKYDKQIEEILNDDVYEKIDRDWDEAIGLFQAASLNGESHVLRPDNKKCGCLTQIRSGELVAWTDELTERIRADERIPKNPEDIEEHHLYVFAEWQRILDKELQRV